jgi:hypothetical protein
MEKTLSQTRLTQVTVRTWVNFVLETGILLSILKLHLTLLIKS